MALDPAKPVQQAKLPPGSELFRSGSRAASLCLLHQGEVTAFQSNPDGSETPLYTYGNNSCPGFATLLLSEKYPCTLKVTKPSAVSSFPVRQGAFTGLILGKLNVGFLAMRSLLQEVIQAQQLVKRYSDFLGRIDRTNDNLTLAYYRCNPSSFEQKEGESSEPMLDQVLADGIKRVDEFQDNGGEIPEVINLAWLEGDHSHHFRAEYGFDSDFDREEFQFLRRMLALPTELQGQLFKSDLNIMHTICLKLAKMIENSHAEIHRARLLSSEAVERLSIGDYSFIEKFFLLTDMVDNGFLSLQDREFRIILQYLLDNSRKLLADYRQLQGESPAKSDASLKKIEDYLERKKGDQPNSLSDSEEITTESGAIIRAGVDVEAIRKELNLSPGKIMGFVGMEQDLAKKMVKEIDTWKKMENPLDSGGDPRKLRRSITQNYWATYEKAFHKFVESNGNVPRPVLLMLLYGYFDDTLLDDEHIATIYDLTDSSRPNKEHPIHNAIQWLKLVGEKQEHPSIDEMGQSFFDLLKLENKDKNWKRESDVPEEFDNFNTRIHHEVNKFLDTTVRLTSGMPTTAFPILTRFQVQISLEKGFVTYRRLSEELTKLLEKDYSAFFREVLLNDEERGILKEFVQEEVIPNFIIVPSIGTKAMMWQELSGRGKTSRGRIAIPSFAMSDLFTMVLEAVGAFRWELTKSIAGPDWNNVSIPSITADYTDYVQFFKKNRELSPEIKEKLASEFKRFRTDRDRFVNDYINWIKFESDGVLKLNRVARGIFYRHVPFAKTIRDDLASQPAYSDLHNRFTNIRNRKLRELEVRYRKYNADGAFMPERLQANIDFYKV